MTLQPGQKGAGEISGEPKDLDGSADPLAAAKGRCVLAGNCNLGALQSSGGEGGIPFCSVAKDACTAIVRSVSEHTEASTD